MKCIYSMEFSFNFLLQATRVLHVGNYDEKELEMIYEYIVAIDNNLLFDFHTTCSVLTYSNDLELYIEIVDALIKIYEEKEEYEKCNSLLKKKEESEIIMNNKSI